MSAFTFRYCLAGLLILSFAFTACSTSEPTANRDTPKTAQDVDLSDYEDFDARPYRAEPSADRPKQLEHDVPETLLKSQAGAGQLERRQGFRIQLFISINRDEASKKRNQFTAWWQQQRVQNSDAPKLPTYMKYKQPYYRVRLGNFASRSQAQQYLSRIQNEFPKASVVPSTVLIRR